MEAVDWGTSRLSQFCNCCVLIKSSASNGCIRMSIEQKIGQMYKALEEMQITEKLSSMAAVFNPGRRGSFSMDFGKGADTPTAANRASQLISAIACLKDHLRMWCTKQNKPFTGDKLIDSNREVAIVHDLWNLDKHGEVDRSRSRLYPRLAEPPYSSLVLKAEARTPRPKFQLYVPIFGGAVGPMMRIHSGATLRIGARVVDKDGNYLGDLEAICEKAVAAWEAELKKVGLTL